MKIHHTICILLISILFAACSSNDDSGSPCDAEATVNESRYNQAPRQGIFIKNVSVSGDCLQVNFEASGCDGSTWVIDLVGSTQVAESLPAQRFIAIDLVNNEACLAVIDTTVSFDLTALRLSGDEIILNLQGWSEKFSYTY